MVGLPTCVSGCRFGSVTCMATGLASNVPTSKQLLLPYGCVSVEPFASARTTIGLAFGQRLPYPALKFSRTSRGCVKAPSSKNGGGHGPLDNGEKSDGRDGGFVNKDDFWYDLFDSTNPSSLVDFKSLEMTASDEARNAFLWAASSSVGSISSEIFQVMLQTERSHIFKELVKAMYQGFALRSAEIRYRFDEKARHGQAIGLARPMKVLSPQERAALPPSVLDFVETKEAEVERLQGFARAIEHLTCRNRLLAYYYGMTEEQKQELTRGPWSSSLRAWLFQRWSMKFSTGWMTTLCFGGRNSWYFRTVSGGEPSYAAPRTLVVEEACVKLGRDYMFTLMYWAMLVGLKFCDLYHRRDLARFYNASEDESMDEASS
eukprot:jgi/Botrbrau1/4776/Bobra.0137s0048.1